MASKLQITGYVATVTACFLGGVALGWTPIASGIDNRVYDTLLSGDPGPARPPNSIVVAVDEPTLRDNGEMQHIRQTLCHALNDINDARPAVVALDVTLASEVDPAEDACLAAALAATPKLVLPSLVDRTGAWEDTAPLFRDAGEALGHVHTVIENSNDGVTRRLALERIFAGQRRWAMAMEAFRLARGADIVESPTDVTVGNVVIPAPRICDDALETGSSDNCANSTRTMYIRYLPPGTIPTLSVEELLHNTMEQNRDQLQGKVVFLGITALTAANDRLVTPLDDNLAGVEVHAQAYETLARGQFLTDASDLAVVGACGALALFAGVAFWFLSGWMPYLAGLGVVGVAAFLPAMFFDQNLVFPLFAPMATAALSSVGAATYQHFVARRQLQRTESEKSRYQQAIHWAAHEMRTPLTAIQGSSELMSRYNLPEEKRAQLSEMINSESKRLARIIQTFLDVERLAEGQMELKKERFDVADIVYVSVTRATPLADRKKIRLSIDTDVNGALVGDRELMEYAFYNLLTNAVKYSPAETHVRVRSTLTDGKVKLEVEDEGIGMDASELKNVFRKFYRTKKAEASGEAGTGIGLSIVEQIVTHHGGKISAASTPGKGSCFTIELATAEPTARV